MKNKVIAITTMVMVASISLALEWNTCCAYITRNDANAKWTLQNDGQGVYIKEWHSTVAKPIEAELQAVEATAITWMIDKTKTTDAEYDNWTAREKALCKLFVKEINKLRALHGLPAYTKQQVMGALKGEM